MDKDHSYVVRTARFTSKPAKDNQHTYVTKNGKFTSKLAKTVEALVREGPRQDVDIGGVLQVDQQA